MGCINSSCFSLKRIVVLPAPSKPKVTTRISIFGPMCTRLSWRKDGLISLIRMNICPLFFPRLGFLNCLKWLCFSFGMHSSNYFSVITFSKYEKTGTLGNLKMPMRMYGHLNSIYQKFSQIQIEIKKKKNIMNYRTTWYFTSWTNLAMTQKGQITLVKVTGMPASSWMWSASSVNCCCCFCSVSSNRLISCFAKTTLQSS